MGSRVWPGWVSGHPLVIGRPVWTVSPPGDLGWIHWEAAKPVQELSFTCTKPGSNPGLMGQADSPWRHSSQIGTGNQLRSERRPSLPPLSSQFRLLALGREPGPGVGLLWRLPRTGVWIWWGCWAGGSWTACCSARLPSFCQPAAVEADWTLRKTQEVTSANRNEVFLSAD